MKKLTRLCLIVLTVLLSVQVNAQNVYTQRFLDLREKMNDPANGYFSADGVPYHSVETLMAEAPDHGHETTSEAYSYWIWMEAMYGGISGDWSYLNNAWTLMETFAIPNSDQQPTTASYDPSAPATYAAEHPLPDYYPSELETSVPVGEDPVSADLTSTYGSEIYAMHWLFDCDNFYGYGNLGDGVSTPSYINTFQRGEQESVWETVPHPSWEDFSWGNDDGTGFLGLFIEDANPAEQWRYTNAPDADARAVQAMYWAVEFAKEQGLDPTSTLPTAKASKMGDFVRLSMFDKYFKPLGVQDKAGSGGVGYESAHYLMSWYFAWGGPLTENGWAWRIGSSHSHFGYQNPVAAYALSEVNELKPISATGVRDWGVSLQRQLEFYTWLQSAEGAIAGGATNCYNGDYETYPAGTSTFYEMAYQEHPVYHDPGSNQWIGMQAWSMERIAELYYISGNEMAKNLLDNWVPWIESEVQLTADGNFQIPATLAWTGQPETWDPVNPVANTNLNVTVTEYGSDLGIAACLAKALTYYAAGTQKYGTLDESAKDLAQEILDRMWDNYYDANGKGVAVTETRGDYARFFEQEVFIPDGFTGTMANGDSIKPGVTFIDIRSKYREDPDFPALEAAYLAGEDYSAKYHRYWAQADIALANAEFGRLFGDNSDTIAVAGIVVTPESLPMVIGITESISAVVSPYNATNKTVSWTSSDESIVTVDATGTVNAIALGSATVTATTEDGGFSDNCAITVTSTPIYDLTVLISGTGTVDLDPAGGVYDENTNVIAIAIPGEDFEFIGWSGDATGTTNPLSITMDANKELIATFAEIPPGCENPGTITLPFEQDGAGEFCWVTTGNIEYVSSWNMTSVSINGTDFTNIWSNEMPERIDGAYNIRYESSVAWSHLEIAGTNGSTPVTYTLTTATDGQGAVSPASGTHDEGDVVNITATPTTGWEFTSWSGDASGTSNPVSVTMDSDKSVTAVFTEIINPVDYSLVITTIGDGSVSLDPFGGIYTEGTPVKLTAIAASGYEFSAWSGDATGSTNPLTITMDADKVVTATFTTIDTSGCDFGTPLATALPSINESYNNIHVIGSGPDLSNINTFTINWDLPNTGMYQISMNTSNGNPNWYVDLNSSQTNSFNSVAPVITFTGTGITGFDGEYYAAIDNGNFVLDAVSGAYSIYFSNSATSPCASFKSAEKDEGFGLNLNITLYPNPADDVVWLKANNSIKSVTIYDLHGKQITIEKFNSNEVEMNVDALQAGTYIIKVESENILMTRLLIIE